MQIIDFTTEHIPQAAALARANYEEERARIPALPLVAQLPPLEPFAANGMGAAALEDGRLVGFLCALEPFENAFGSTGARGAFSPAHAHGVVAPRRGRIYQRLYQAAAAKWVARGVSSHAIALYYHDEAALRAMFSYGFGQRCADALRKMEPIQAPACPGYEFCELGPQEDVANLRRLLGEHLAQSPCFMKKLPAPEREHRRRDTRLFAARRGGEIVAFIESAATGEHFATAAPKMGNICGAFCLPEHRGRGVYQNLLNHMIETLAGEGNQLLGVDYESINPTAIAFWEKYFQPYTAGLVRRVDEGSLL